MSDNLSLTEVMITIVIAVLPLLLEDDPIPQHTSILTGRAYYDELMDSQSEPLFRTACRMDRGTFVKFVQMLQEHGNLQSGRSVNAGQKLMIFIYVCSGFSNRQAASRFQHSGDTIHHCVYDVSKAMLRCKERIFVRPKAEDPVPDRIAQNGKFFPWFQYCIGALDGSHIPAVLPADEQRPFRNRKGFISQNVLAVCDFNLLFSYSLCGWEGSAHDGRVLDDAKDKGKHLNSLI
jgi:hypothetical protein